MQGARSGFTEVTNVTLELTNSCQLDCGHCYAESGPLGSHGEMSRRNWLGVVDDAVKQGVGLIQLIGGEPTLHPDFLTIATYAWEQGLNVGVYTNLVRMTPELWELFCRPRVRVTTSFYSDDPEEHASITGAANSHRLTTRHIGEAVQRGVDIRAAVIRVLQEQRVDQAVELLRSLGVTQIDFEDVRSVGRAASADSSAASEMDQLCGGCVNSLAVLPSGVVTPCVFARKMSVGNVRAVGLEAVMSGSPLQRTRARLAAHFEQRGPQEDRRPCSPDCVPAPMPAGATREFVSAT